MKLSTGDEIKHYNGGGYVEITLSNGIWVLIDTDGTVQFNAETPQASVADLHRIIELSDELNSIVELMSI